MKLLKLAYFVVLLFTAIHNVAADPQATPATGPLISNGGFENGIAGWGIFIPGESKGANCRFDVVADAPHSGVNCARFQSDDFARFSAGCAGFPVQAGERYHVSVWIRADSAATVRANMPGFAIRLLLRQGNADAAGGHMFIVPGNRVSRNTPAEPASPTLPTTWTPIDAVVEIPSGVDQIGVGLFSWWTKGTLYADDLFIEKVDTSTAITPLWQPVDDTVAITISDDALLAALNLNAPGMEKVKAAAQAGGKAIDWKAVQSAYLDYRRNASPARWKIMPSDRPTQPSKQDDVDGDHVLQHRVHNNYHFQPSDADMGQDFNWTYNPVLRSDPAFTDEWTYCAVGRTEFWETLAGAYWKTGDEKYAAGWVASLEDFAAKNPMHYDPVPGVPSLWRTLDSALRISISWPNSYYHFLQSPSFTPEANWLYLKLNFEHALLLSHGLKDGTRHGNWATTECGGLYVIGTLFSEFHDAASWRQYAIDRLTGELDIIVPPDGFEAELTPNYHFVALDGFRRPIEIAKLNHLAIPESFQAKVMAMYRAPVLVMDQRGQNVPTNDSGPVSAALRAQEGLRLGDDSLLEWAVSHGQKGQAPPDSTALPYAGFYAMRGGWKRDDLFLFFRGGPTGIGHQHEDMLEVVLRAWNKTLLFDPGSYPYDQSDWRRFANGTASHNTIIVDSKWQHRGATKPPISQPTGDPWVTTPLFDYVAGTYDAGYQESVYRPRPFDPQTWKGEPDKSVSHTRRVLFLRPYYALVLDTLDGTGTHTYDAHFNLDSPSARLDPTTHATFSQNTEGAQLALYPLEMENLAVDIVQGQMKPLLGWMPLDHRPIPTIRFHKQQEAPAIFATFLYPFRDTPPDFAATPLPVIGDGLWSRFLKTSQENAEIILSKNGAAVAFSFKSSFLGDVAAEATGLIIRQPGGTGVVYAGGIDLHSYRNDQVELTLDKPASLVISPRKDSLLCFNPGEAAVAMTVKRPFARNATLAPQTWTSVTASGDSPATPPILFNPLDPSVSGASYDNYLKNFPDVPPSGALTPIRIKSKNMTLPAGASLAAKTGAEGNVLARWEETGTHAVAHVDVPQAGWYRLKIRYCSGEMLTRSLLINGKVPFNEVDEFPLPSTIGNPPSDGWSNVSDDWHEVVLGAEQAAPGWKIYLGKGSCELDLRNDGGGLNLDWLELDPL